MLFNKNIQIVKSRAKINLSLKVVGTRENGYHDLEMVMVPLEMHDVIEIVRRPGALDTYITSDDVGLAHLHNNLCTVAVEAMRKEFGFKDNFDINIHKEIPFAAGLGGGSSNAAAVIESLIKILGIKTDDETINRIALSIGADVPFFLKGKPCLAQGLGEQLTPIEIKSPYHCLIVKPQQGLSTKAVYEVADNFDKADIDTNKILAALKEDDIVELGKDIGNDLYAPAKSLLPEVEKIVESLKADGFPVAAMTGSGSACFALSKDKKLVKEKAKDYRKLGYIVKVTKTII
ncbi:MAG: 4-(cytidine 5'-diphospho)-2-C-methyl-D-erythritol kinase [Bacilli bacterium]|nr:4-(cytidine 5'-diphospho)-2-C-methyl-D-erythritol kinase [Bacilli bacterium]